MLKEACAEILACLGIIRNFFCVPMKLELAKLFQIAIHTGHHSGNSPVPVNSTLANMLC